MGRPVADRARRGLTVFLAVVTVLAGAGFLVKLFEFFTSIEDASILGFAIAPLANYACVSGGFLALLLWAFLSGQFSDTERTKIEFLEEQERMDREDPWLRRAGGGGAAPAGRREGT